MSVDNAKVIIHSQKCRYITLNSVIRLEGDVADFEGKLDLRDGERVTLNYIANKLQMYDAEFHKHHYKLVDCINDSGQLEAQQRIFDDHDHRMLEFFTRIANLQSRRKTVIPPPEPAEETISLKAYNHSLWLITSREKIIDDRVEKN